MTRFSSENHVSGHLHGFEWIEQADISPIQVRKSSIIGLVGTAPQGPIQTPTLVKGYKEAVSTFGDLTAGYTIPQALKAIFDQGENVGFVIVVNVFDPAIHVDANNNPTPSAVTDADIIGGVDTNTGERKGIEALLDSSSLFGFAPKVLIAPGYSSSKAVMDALIAKAQIMRSMAIADSAPGWKDTDIIGYRGQFSDPRAIITYPLVKFYNHVSGQEEVAPYSPYLAGVISKTDNTLGFWHSPSNKTILGITGLERPIPYITFHSPNSFANYLNENHILTAIHYEGYRTWGNRSAATDEWRFIPVRRQFDIIEDSIEYYTLRLLDRPINRAFFEDLQTNVQMFLNELIGRGAIVEGKVQILPEDNPVSQLSNGIVTARLQITPTFPAERISFIAELYVEGLKKLFEQQ